MYTGIPLVVFQYKERLTWGHRGSQQQQVGCLKNGGGALTKIYTWSQCSVELVVKLTGLLDTLKGPYSDTKINPCKWVGGLGGEANNIPVHPYSP